VNKGTKFHHAIEVPADCDEYHT